MPTYRRLQLAMTSAGNQILVTAATVAQTTTPFEQLLTVWMIRWPGPAPMTPGLVTWPTRRRRQRRRSR